MNRLFYIKTINSNGKINHGKTFSSLTFPQLVIQLANGGHQIVLVEQVEQGTDRWFNLTHPTSLESEWMFASPSTNV